MFVETNKVDVDETAQAEAKRLDRLDGVSEHAHQRGIDRMTFTCLLLRECISTIT